MSDGTNGQCGPVEPASRDAAWELINAITDQVGPHPSLTPAEWGQLFEERFRQFRHEHRSATDDQRPVIERCERLFCADFGAHLFTREMGKARKQSHQAGEAASRAYARATQAEAERANPEEPPRASQFAGPESTPPPEPKQPHAGKKDRGANGHASNGAGKTKQALDALILTQLALPITVRGNKTAEAGNLLKHEIIQAKSAIESNMRTQYKTWNHLNHYESLLNGWTSKSLNQLIVDGKIEPEQLPVPPLPDPFPFTEDAA